MSEISPKEIQILNLLKFIQRFRRIRSKNIQEKNINWGFLLQCKQIQKIHSIYPKDSLLEIGANIDQIDHLEELNLNLIKLPSDQTRIDLKDSHAIYGMRLKILRINHMLDFNTHSLPLISSSYLNKILQNSPLEEFSTNCLVYEQEKITDNLAACLTLKKFKISSFLGRIGRMADNICKRNLPLLKCLIGHPNIEYVKIPLKSAESYMNLKSLVDNTPNLKCIRVSMDYSRLECAQLGNIIKQHPNISKIVFKFSNFSGHIISTLEGMKNSESIREIKFTFNKKLLIEEQRLLINHLSTLPNLSKIELPFHGVWISSELPTLLSNTLVSAITIEENYCSLDAYMQLIAQQRGIKKVIIFCNHAISEVQGEINMGNNMNINTNINTIESITLYHPQINTLIRASDLKRPLGYCKAIQHILHPNYIKNYENLNKLIISIYYALDTPSLHILLDYISTTPSLRTLKFGIRPKLPKDEELDTKIRSSLGNNRSLEKLHIGIFSKLLSLGEAVAAHVRLKIVVFIFSSALDESTVIHTLQNLIYIYHSSIRVLGLESASYFSNRVIGVLANYLLVERRNLLKLVLKGTSIEGNLYFYLLRALRAQGRYFEMVIRIPSILYLKEEDEEYIIQALNKIKCLMTISRTTHMMNYSF